jgi:hypothetical protein
MGATSILCVLVLALPKKRFLACSLSLASVVRGESRKFLTVPNFEVKDDGLMENAARQPNQLAKL